MFATDTLTYDSSWRTAAEINSAMGRVYGHMSLAVLTSMIVSFLVSQSPALMAFLFTGVMKWIVMFLPLVAVFGIAYALNNNPSKPVAVGLLHGFAAIMGLSFATIFIVFKMGSIFGAFMGGAILFGVMSGYGYFTKNSLDSMGKFMFIGLIAIIIASIINIFIGSSLFAMVISALAIIIFLGLTAYDTQKIREMVSMDTSDAMEVQGALTLYINFVNIFLSLLQLTGSKNE
jgi:FtsH-binding integral membrane protein